MNYVMGQKLFFLPAILSMSIPDTISSNSINFDHKYPAPSEDLLLIDRHWRSGGKLFLKLLIYATNINGAYLLTERFSSNEPLNQKQMFQCWRKYPRIWLNKLCTVWLGKQIFSIFEFMRCIFAPKIVETRLFDTNR